MVPALRLLSTLRGLCLIRRGRRRLDLGGVMVPLVMAVMAKRKEDAALQVLDRAVELGPTTRRSPPEPTGDILR
jgi:hypothetical protein